MKDFCNTPGMSWLFSTNPRTSVIISLISGVGLVALVGLAPSKTDRFVPDEESPLDSESNIQEQRSIRSQRTIPSAEEDQIEDESNPLPTYLRILPRTFFRTPTSGDRVEENLGANPSFDRSRATGKDFGPSNLFFRGSTQQESRIYSWSDGDGRMSMNALTSGSRIGTNRRVTGVNGGANRGESQWGDRGLEQSHTFSGREKLEYFEIDLPLTRSVSAVLTSSNRDIYYDRQMDAQSGGLALAGISVSKGQFLSTRLVAGDSNLQLHRQTYNPYYMGMASQRGLSDPGYNEREQSPVRTFEWQTNIQPTRGVRLQTAIYNMPREQGNQSVQSRFQSTPDTGRLSVFLGEKWVVFNIKYDHRIMTANSRMMAMREQLNSDFASMGMIFYFDESQNYSLYLGGNQSITPSRTGQQNRSGDTTRPAGFSASFRGKRNSSSSTQFFLNVQNQPVGLNGSDPWNQWILVNNPNRDWANFYEYATSLGLEINF